MVKTVDSCIRGCANVEMINRGYKLVTDKAEQIEAFSQILNLMGNPTRFKIIYLIIQEEKICVCDLSDILNISISAISQQLKKLKDLKLMSSVKEGQTIYYSIHPKHKNTVEVIMSQFNKL
jgi:DNA-binding transcriptional ArsR family regulator